MQKGFPAGLESAENPFLSCSDEVFPGSHESFGEAQNHIEEKKDKRKAGKSAMHLGVRHPAVSGLLFGLQRFQ